MTTASRSTSGLLPLLRSLSIFSSSATSKSTLLRSSRQYGSLSSSTSGSSSIIASSSSRHSPLFSIRTSQAIFPAIRCFSTTPQHMSWLFPKNPKPNMHRSGQVHIRTGGSVKGTTVVWGDYGIRMIDRHRRISGKQLRVAEEIVRKRLKGEKYKLFMRVTASIPVHVKGNEVRMGGGRGSFDHWAARVPVSKIIFELKGDLHEATARDAFRLAGQKLPGCYEFVKRTDPPVMGITKMTPEFVQELIDSKHKLPFQLQKMREAQRSSKGEASPAPLADPNAVPGKAPPSPAQTASP